MQELTIENAQYAVTDPKTGEVIKYTNTIRPISKKYVYVPLNDDAEMSLPEYYAKRYYKALGK